MRILSGISKRNNTPYLVGVLASETKSELFGSPEYDEEQLAYWKQELANDPFYVFGKLFLGTYFDDLRTITTPQELQELKDEVLPILESWGVESELLK